MKTITLVLNEHHEKMCGFTGNIAIVDKDMLLDFAAPARLRELAVQFAAEAGATMIATVSSPLQAARTRQAGTDHVVDYHCEDVVAALKTTCFHRLTPRVSGIRNG